MAHGAIDVAQTPRMLPLAGDGVVEIENGGSAPVFVAAVAGTEPPSVLTAPAFRVGHGDSFTLVKRAGESIWAWSDRGAVLGHTMAQGDAPDILGFAINPMAETSRERSNRGANPMTTVTWDTARAISLLFTETLADGTVTPATRLSAASISVTAQRADFARTPQWITPGGYRFRVLSVTPESIVFTDDRGGNQRPRQNQFDGLRARISQGGLATQSQLEDGTIDSDSITFAIDGGIQLSADGGPVRVVLETEPLVRMRNPYYPALPDRTVVDTTLTLPIAGFGNRYRYANPSAAPTWTRRGKEYRLFEVARRSYTFHSVDGSVPRESDFEGMSIVATQGARRATDAAITGGRISFDETQITFNWPGDQQEQWSGSVRVVITGAATEAEGGDVIDEGSAMFRTPSQDATYTLTADSATETSTMSVEYDYTVVGAMRLGSLADTAVSFGGGAAAFSGASFTSDPVVRMSRVWALSASLTLISPSADNPPPTGSWFVLKRGTTELYRGATTGSTSLRAATTFAVGDKLTLELWDSTPPAA